MERSRRIQLLETGVRTRLLQRLDANEGRSVTRLNEVNLSGLDPAIHLAHIQARGDRSIFWIDKPHVLAALDAPSGRRTMCAMDDDKLAFLDGDLGCAGSLPNLHPYALGFSG